MRSTNLRWACAIAICAFIMMTCSATVAQDQDKRDQAKKDDEKPGKPGGTPGIRWEGVVVRSNKEKGTFTVRQRGSNAEKTIEYDSSTKFTAAEHHGKPTKIDPGEIKDGDRIIALGKAEKGGSVLHASVISKRLTEH